MLFRSGKMPRQLNLKFAEYCRDTGKRWIATYGQSEGTARMAYLPAEYAISKCGSIGWAVPNAELSLIDSDGNVIEGSHTEGEMCYRGRNVTMGYACSREDLLLGDERNGFMRTGDLAYRDEQKKFNQRLGIYYGVMAAGVIVAAIGLMTQINVLTLLGVVAFFAGLVILSWVDGYTEYAKRVMTAKALMGEEMPEDVVNAGIELVKKQGGSLSALKSQTREFSHILYHLCQGIFTAAAMLEKIPGLKSVSGIAQSMIKKAYRRINLLLEGYLFAKYGEMTKETYYDGVSLLLQDGRTFLVKSVKDAAVSELLVTLSVIGTLVFVALGGILKNVVFVVLGIACVVLYVVVAIVYDSNKDFDMLASYIEYASTHEVNEEYRNSLLAATDAATQVNMVAGALKNPAVNGIMGAAGAAEKLFGNKDEK